MNKPWGPLAIPSEVAIGKDLLFVFGGSHLSVRVVEARKRGCCVEVIGVLQGGIQDGMEVGRTFDIEDSSRNMGLFEL